MAKSNHLPEPAPAEAPLGSRDMVRVEFGRRLSAALLAKRPDPWSQADLARAAGLGRDAISTYVRGRSFPEPSSLKRISDALGMKPEDLVPGLEGIRAEGQVPAFSVRSIAGREGMMWLQINQAVTMEQVEGIVAVLRRPKVA